MSNKIISLPSSRRYGITQSMYDKKMQELLQRQHEIANYLETQIKADEVFYITVKSMLELCSKAYEIFESSSMDKKRKLMSFLLSNITIKDASVCYSLKEPFNSLTNLDENSKWWAVVDELRTKYHNEILLFSTQINNFQQQFI